MILRAYFSEFNGLLCPISAVSTGRFPMSHGSAILLSVIRWFRRQWSPAFEDGSEIAMVSAWFWSPKCLNTHQLFQSSLRSDGKLSWLQNVARFRAILIQLSQLTCLTNSATFTWWTRPESLRIEYYFFIIQRWLSRRVMKNWHLPLSHIANA